MVVVFGDVVDTALGEELLGDGGGHGCEGEVLGGGGGGGGGVIMEEDL